MTLLDAILGLVGLLLWINWRSIDLSPTAHAPSLSLLSTLRRAEVQPEKRWVSLTLLLVLLIGRPLLYWQIGPSIGWTPGLRLGPVSLAFRSDYLGRMFLFSFLGFGWVLVRFHFFLALLCVLHHRLPDTVSFQRFVRAHLGWLGRRHWVLQLLLPLVVFALLWGLLNPAFVRLGLLPRNQGLAHTLQQSVLVSCGLLLSLSTPVIGTLALHVLNSYVYLGHHEFWNYINVTARQLLRPIQAVPLTIARVDFAPILIAISIGFAAQAAGQGVVVLYRKLPF